MQKSLSVLVVATLLCAAGAAQAKYYPPVDRLVLNEILSAAPGAIYPFYLPKRGRYYAEIIREGKVAVTTAQALDLTVRVMRDTKVLFEKHVQQTLAPDAEGATLFWINSPYDVPDRHELTVTVATNTPLAAPLRLQITRKYELPPLIIR